MGKDWLLYFVGGNGGSATKSTKKRKSVGRRRTEREATSPGCMYSVFQLFHLHHFHFPHTTLKIDDDDDDESFLHFHHHDPSPPVTSKAAGVEAPRNSLELLETSSSSSAIKDEQFFNIPVGIQIKTRFNHQNTLTTPRASTSSSSKARGDHQDLFSSEYCSGSSSPGPKTPNLVARLMGLDLLPESESPSSSRGSSRNTNLKQDINPPSSPFLQSRRRRQCSGRINNFYDDNVDITGGGSVSLPETPRISSSSRRSDVEHSRLSLQMNRDHVHVAGSEESEYCSVNYKKMQGISKRRDVMRPVVQDENTSPAASGGSKTAKNIVHQVKERISKNRGRKFGGDITNTNTIKTAGEDEHVKQPKMNNTTRTDQDEDHCSSTTGKQTTPTCSPRLRLLTLDSKNKGTIFSTPQIQKSNVSLPQIVKKSNKDGKDKFNSRLIKNPPPPPASNAIRNKKEEPFIRPTATKKLAVSVSEKKKKKSSKRTPLSNELLQLPVCSRKDSCLPLTNKFLLHHHHNKQQDHDAERGKTSTTTRLSSCASPSYCPEEGEVALGFPENIQDKARNNGNGKNDDETQMGIILIHHYVKRILKRSGLDNATPVTLAKWFSPLQPLDPSIFHYMELFHPAGGRGGILSHRSNRKLVFQLVDELLVEILKPYIDPNPFVINGGNCKMMMMMYGSELIEKVCKTIEKFPSANCQVLEDIDALIELADDEFMRKKSRRKSLRHEKEEEEIGEGIALEILERLVHETWSMMLLL